jgi:hypothetical protein
LGDLPYKNRADLPMVCELRFSVIAVTAAAPLTPSGFPDLIIYFQIGFLGKQFLCFYVEYNFNNKPREQLGNNLDA